MIDHFNKSWYAIEILRKHKGQFKSKRLIRLLTVNKKESEDGEDDEDKGDDGLLPLLRENIAQFDEYIRWEGNTPTPQKGLVESYDLLQDEVTKIK